MNAASKTPLHGHGTPHGGYTSVRRQATCTSGVVQPKAASAQFGQHRAAAASSSQPPPAPKVLQPKTAAAQTGRHPNAPAAYRPQPFPKVLQQKPAVHQQTPQPTAHTAQPRRAPLAPAAYRPQPVPQVLQPKTTAAGSPHRQPLGARPSSFGGSVQALRSTETEARKFSGGASAAVAPWRVIKVDAARAGAHRPVQQAHIQRKTGNVEATVPTSLMPPKSPFDVSGQTHPARVVSRSPLRQKPSGVQSQTRASAIQPRIAPGSQRFHGTSKPPKSGVHFPAKVIQAMMQTNSDDETDIDDDDLFNYDPYDYRAKGAKMVQDYTQHAQQAITDLNYIFAPQRNLSSTQAQKMYTAVHGNISTTMGYFNEYRLLAQKLASQRVNVTPQVHKTDMEYTRAMVTTRLEAKNINTGNINDIETRLQDANTQHNKRGLPPLNTVRKTHIRITAPNEDINSWPFTTTLNNASFNNGYGSLVSTASYRIGKLGLDDTDKITVRGVYHQGNKYKLRFNKQTNVFGTSWNMVGAKQI